MLCVTILILCLFALSCSGQTCGKLGAKCDRTIFNKCCDGLYCVLKGFADGTCEKCLPKGHFCLNDAECCSGNCAWYRFCRS
ncbi:unnamed protein product [Hymenolepis diminuta]|uniref:UPF0506 domain-containing protein n=1 Tax=Hymenolepis diminuta TaxID=6216 RepID=A0A564Y0Z0_HYMDI|nr:unnamed protein product [Hymenolepis diminuta]